MFEYLETSVKKVKCQQCSKIRLIYLFKRTAKVGYRCKKVETCFYTILGKY